MGARFYDLNAIELIVGDDDISAGGDDGAIEVEWGSDVIIPKVLVNGTALVSRSNNNSAIVSIICGSHTSAARRLGELLNEQRAQAPQVTDLPFFLRDPSNGDEIKDRQCIFLDRPSPNKSMEDGDRVFRVFLPEGGAVGNLVVGALNP
jgi:hypothetical protein